MCVWKKRTYGVTVVQGITEFLQGVQELDIVPSLVGEVRDSPVMLLPLLQQTNCFNKISHSTFVKKNVFAISVTHVFQKSLFYLNEFAWLGKYLYCIC